MYKSKTRFTKYMLFGGQTPAYRSKHSQKVKNITSYKKIRVMALNSPYNRTKKVTFVAKAF